MALPLPARTLHTVQTEFRNYRRDHLRALAQRVEVDAKEVRIMGSKSILLRTLVAASSAKNDRGSLLIPSLVNVSRRVVAADRVGNRFGPRLAETRPTTLQGAAAAGRLTRSPFRPARVTGRFRAIRLARACLALSCLIAAGTKWRSNIGAGCGDI
jgi:hypothetical protein